jgi:hypothetical protein
MQFVKGLCLFGLSFGIVFCAACFASAQEVSFVSNPVWLSTTQTTEGETVQASTVITKQDAESVTGEVAFFSNGKDIGTAEFSLPSNVGGVVVAVSFTPEKGTHLVSAKVTRAVALQNGASVAVDVTAEAKAGETLTIDPDNDHDKIVDAQDADDDNDGISDADEKTGGTDPLKQEANAAPAVAGAATSTSLAGATETAKDIGAQVFAKTEELRNSVANYFDGKVEETEAARQAKQEAVKDFVEGDIEERLIDVKPLSEQVKDTSGILEGLKLQVYKIGSFVFSNMYVFYIVFIGLILLILRKIWKRYSLD